MLGKLVAKAVSKAGRPKRRRGPKPKPKEVKAKKAPVRKKPAKVVRSPRENAELKRLISSQKRDDAPDSNPLPKRRATGPEGSKPVEQGPLLSKVQLPEKMSKAQARRLIMEGKAKVRTDKNGKKKLVSTGEYAPARGVVAEEMGLSKRGKLPSEAELKEMGGFEMRKTGGKAKSNVRKAVSAQKKKNPKARLASSSGTSMIKTIASESPSRKKPPSFSSMITNALKKRASPKGEKRIQESAKKAQSTKRNAGKNTPVVVKKPKANLKYAAESGPGSTPIGTASKQSTIKSKPDKRKSLSDALFGGFKTGDFTAKNQTVKNPFTGNDMTIEYDYPEDKKMGGKVRRRMGGVIKKGFGKATRGY
jgi:hypothetical protein